MRLNVIPNQANGGHGARRACGDCHVCCYLLEVPSLAKPRRVACGHLCQQGCAIYSQRPTECSGFYCLWAMGNVSFEGNEDRESLMRPDKLGVMFHVADGRVVVAQEVTRGGLDKRHTRRLVEGFVNAGEVVLLVHADGREFVLGPTDKVLKMKTDVA